MMFIEYFSVWGRGGPLRIRQGGPAHQLYTYTHQPTPESKPNYLRGVAKIVVYFWDNFAGHF